MEKDLEIREQTFLEWLFMVLGPYTYILPFVAFVTFVLTLILVIRGKGGLAGAALALIVPAPFLLGIFGGMTCALTAASVLAGSLEPLKGSEVCLGIQESLLTPLVGLMLTIPSYALATVGLLVRSLRGDAEQVSNVA